MNVIGTRPDHWWRDRSGARRKLVASLSVLTGEDEVTVVFDGHPETGELEVSAESSVTVLFAPGGPNAADDRIASLVDADPEPASLVVVTSDVTLAGRVRAHGAEVVPSKRFRQLIDR